MRKALFYFAMLAIMVLLAGVFAGACGPVPTEQPVIDVGSVKVDDGPKYDGPGVWEFSEELVGGNTAYTYRSDRMACVVIFDDRQEVVGVDCVD